MLKNLAQHANNSLRQESIMARYEHVMKEEQRETAQELAEILRVAQAMGRRLAHETHGDLYEDVRVFNELLHQVRTHADALREKLPYE